jgi:5-oxoprolinase (ATP-hydrolysing)
VAADLDVWIDRGGTFTDGVAVVAKTGEVRVIKVLSGDDAPARAIRGLAGVGASDPLPRCRIRMGTTLATNALLERKGSTVGMLLPAGLGDLLQIGDQSRGDLFDLRAGRPAPLTDLVEVVSARVDVAGRELAPVDPSEVREALARLRARGAEAVVVALLHAHRFPEHERSIGLLAAEAGFFVVCSHEVSAEAGLLARAQTALVDAYLTPGLRRHMQALAREASPSSLELLTSAGQLVPHDSLRGRDAVLSGPAGGAVACRRVAEQAGEPEALGFDMGGTSTDVCRVSERGFERRREAMLAGVRVRAPMVAVHTVAAGGGSLCRFDGQRLTVGPESAGASPGPLVYGRPEACEPTLTDVAVFLGRVRGDRFPIPLDEARARAGIAELAVRAGLAPEVCARGLFAIAVEHMAGAIATVSTARGHDPRTHALVLFGGAAGQWGCAVARRLGVRRLLAHPLAGVLSAFGIGLAPRGRFAEAPCLGPLDAERVAAAEATLRALEAAARAELAGRAQDAEDAEDAAVERWLGLRYVGSEAGLDVRFVADGDALAARFEEAHLRRFGYVRREHAIELVRVRVQVESPSDAVVLPTSPTPSGRPRGRATLEGTEVDLWWREDLPYETPLRGPLLVLEATGTLAVDAGFELVRRRDDLIVLDDLEAVTSAAHDRESARAREGAHDREPGREPDGEPDPVRLEVFAHAFTAVAERMGVVLQRTALSTNVRDRLDFSCAVFDATGALVANAPHIPVHLGAMGLRSARWRVRGRTSLQATSSRPTIRARVDRTCRTSRSSRPCTTRTARSGRSSPRAVTTRTWAASRRARCRRPRPRSPTRAWCCGRSAWSTRAASNSRRCVKRSEPGLGPRAASTTTSQISKLRSRRVARGRSRWTSSRLDTGARRSARTCNTSKTRPRARWRRRSRGSRRARRASKTPWTTAPRSASDSRAATGGSTSTFREPRAPTSATSTRPGPSRRRACSTCCAACSAEIFL